MKKYKKILLIMVLVFIFISLNNYIPKADTILDLKVNGADTPQEYVENIKLLIFLTILSLLPSVLVMVTSFSRIAIVLSFLKSALGIQQSIPNQVLIGLAIFLTLFIMQPVYTEINNTALEPYSKGKLKKEAAIDIGVKPLKNFMLKETRQKDLQLFVEITKTDEENLTVDNIPLTVLIPSFVISELRTAFQMGFLLFIPFLIIDLVVSSVLMSMGMFMLSPVMVSLPFKILLFLMVDGWNLIVKSLVNSFI